MWLNVFLPQAKHASQQCTIKKRLLVTMAGGKSPFERDSVSDYFIPTTQQTKILFCFLNGNVNE